MQKYATKAYDFAYLTGKKLPADGLIGDPEVHRQQAPPQNDGPKRMSKKAQLCAAP